MSVQPTSAAPNAPTGNRAVVVSNARRWTIVGLLFTASLLNYFDRQTVSFALPLISKDFNLGPESKGVLQSAFFWSYALMQIPMGFAADRLNLRWVYAGAFALWSIAQGMTGFAGSLATLIVFRIILGIGEAIYLPGGTKIVSILFKPAERGLPCGFFDSGTRTGLVLEGILLPWLLVRYGWHNTFAIIGFTALLWLAPWLWATPKQLRGAAPAMPGQNRETKFAQALSLLRNRNLIGICLAFFCFDYFWYLLIQWLPDYLFTVRHFSLREAGFYASLPMLVFGVCQPIGGWIGDRLVRAGWNETRTRKGIVTVAFLTGLLLIPAARANQANAAIILIAGSCLVGLATANMLVILQNCAHPEKIGLWTGIYNFVGNVAGGTAPIVTGLLIKHTGSYTPAFALAALMLAASPLAYWFIVGELKHSK